ncbi:hypothetical protein BDB00DRAFT_219792 [Zychaea mexicana]|uniref:uncharacterized protein n=1 Tax=Zychaea mexicana TaxID=64656 RepID=UPI0022FEB0CA|nr:uncharacterized protein BDB00DRAFT_219792 [Zychaea mexicana]KAI9499127.1 hypothetical protein BDB00DRAFT_219792 [Zychaea mexicana]
MVKDKKAIKRSFQTVRKRRRTRPASNGQTKMHDAFQVTTVVDKVNRIESIFAHGDRLLIGTGVGQLLVYDIKEPLVADDNEIPEVTLANTIKQFSKRPIEQLDIIKEIDVLVSLSGTYLTLSLTTTT